MQAQYKYVKHKTNMWNTIHSWKSQHKLAKHNTNRWKHTCFVCLCCVLVGHRRRSKKRREKHTTTLVGTRSAHRYDIAGLVTWAVTQSPPLLVYVVFSDICVVFFANLCCDFRLYIVFHILVLCFTYLLCVLHICIVFCIPVLCFVCLCCVLYLWATVNNAPFLNCWFTYNIESLGRLQNVLFWKLSILFRWRFLWKQNITRWSS